jgi:hypothetical protein
MAESILTYLWQVLLATLIQTLVFFGPGLVLTLILHFETRFIQNRIVGTLGLKWYLGLFGWLGTIIHELGHAIFCLIFGHKISEMKLFDPDPETGTLGYVKHSYNSKNIYQLVGNFFIGIGPILLGTAVIFLLAFWLLRLNPPNLNNGFSNIALDLNTWDTFKTLLQTFWNSSSNLLGEVFSRPHLSSWEWYVFIYLAFAIGSSITLSPPDIKAAFSGFGIILILIFIINLATIWTGDFISRIVFSIAAYYSLFYAIVFLILLINLAVALLLLIPSSLLRPSHSKAA